MHRLAALHAVVDGLDHDHGIVDQHAEDDDHAEQHRNVQRVTQRMEDGKGAGQREGNAERNQDCDAGAEEQPADRQHQHQTLQRVLLHGGDRLARRHRLVVKQLQLHAVVGEARVLFGDVGIEPLDQLQRIGAALLGHGEDYRALALVAGQAAGLGAAARNLGNVAQRHRLPSRGIADRNAGDFVGIGGLADHAHQPRRAFLLAGGFDLAGEGVAEPGHDIVRDVGSRQPTVGQRHRIEFDLQFGIAHAGGEHLVHARNAFDVVLELSRPTAQQFVGGLAGDQHHGRRKAVRGGDLDDARVLGLGRQFALRLVLDFAAQIVDALVENALVDVAEAHQDGGDVLARRRHHEADVGDALDRILQRLGHALFDILGRGPRQHRRDHHPVEIDLRVLLARHGQIGQRAHDQHHREGDVGQRVVLDQPCVEIHFAADGFSKATVMPSCRAWRPRVTICASGEKSALAGRPSWACGSSRKLALLPSSTNTP